MPRFNVTCADRGTGREYRLNVSAASERAAIDQACRDGHMAGTAVLIQDTDDPVVAELRLIRGQLEQLSGRKLSVRRVASGVLLAMLVWVLLVLAVMFVLSSINAYERGLSL